jgi:hypothetical protein
MKDCRFRHVQMIAVLLLILIGLFLLQGSRRMRSKDAVSIETYGGTLPEKMLGALQSMNADLAQARKIVRSDSDQIVFISTDEKSNHYEYSHGTLWRNDSPCLLQVHAFHFEYRDKYGNLLTPCSNHLESVETVAYVIRLGTDPDHVLVSYKTRIHSEERLTSLLDKATLAQVPLKTL